jgi:hypothetical protein
VRPFISVCFGITQGWFYSVTKADIGLVVRLNLEVPETIEYPFRFLQHVQIATPDLVTRDPEALGRMQTEERQVLPASNANNQGITALVEHLFFFQITNIANDFL